MVLEDERDRGERRSKNDNVFWGGKIKVGLHIHVKKILHSLTSQCDVPYLNIKSRFFALAIRTMSTPGSMDGLDIEI